MKWFFAGLLLANVAFLVWHWQRVDGGTGQISAAADSPAAKGTGLTLLRELETMPGQRTEVPVATAGEPQAPGQEGAPVEVADVEQPHVESVRESADAQVGEVAAELDAKALAGSVVQPQPLLCQRLAYMESKSDMQSTIAALQQAGAEAIKQGSEVDSKKRYWVLLPPASNATATNATIDRLKRAGIKDYYLIRSGDNKNAISLGVFSSPDAAQRRYREIRDLKFKPRVEDISTTIERWWVEFSWPAQRPEAAWREALPQAQRKLTVTACP